MIEQQESPPPEFSVIITCYDEEHCVEEFHARLTRTMQATGRTFEIVMVDDGSEDATFAKIRAIFEKDPFVAVAIGLFRNAGQAAAMSAGIAHARGRHFIFMDSDLQLEPEELPLLLEKFDEGCDIVSGARRDRRDPLYRRLPSLLANAVMRKVADHPVSDFGCTFKIYRGNLVRAFGFGPSKPWRTAYVFARAKTVVEVRVSHRARSAGGSGWTFKRLSGLLMDQVVGATHRPFQLLSLGCLGLALLIVLRVLLDVLVPFSLIKEVTTGLIINSLLIHLLVVLGVLAAIGEYVIRTYLIVTGDPIYVVRTLLTK